MRKPLKRSLYKIFVSLFVIVYSFIPPAIAIDDLSSYPQEETPSPIVEETETVEEVVLEDPVTVEEPPIVREKKDPQLDLNTENLIFATIQSFVSFVCTDVVDDTAGANDEPGQKDLTEMCADYLSGAVNIQWNWDDTAWSGANTGDGCALFDSDGDGFANYSLCVIVSGDPATYSTHILYSCSDTSTNKCFGSTPLTSTGIECSAFNDDTPTFGGDDDTTAQCTVQLSSVGGGELIDVCSYPSGQPNSDPSDCIIFQPKSGKLEVIKDLEPNLDPGLFNLLIDGMVYASNIGEGGTTGEEVLLAGTYTVSETAGTLTSLSDYTTSIECKDLNGTGSVIAFDTDSSVSVTIEEDTDVVCKITNTRSGGTLIVKKIVTNDNGGNKTYSDFSFQVNSDSAIPFEIDGQNDLSVSPGTYTITEPSVTGYSTTYDNCTDVVVSSNETETCTITNNDIAPKLTLVKTVVNDDGGTKVVSDFPLFISLIPATSGVSYNLLANTQYVATETTQTGYAASVWGGDCNADGTITLQPGDNKTCTITNDDIAPQLTLVKVVVNDNGGTKAIEDFPLFIGDMQVVSGVASEVMANTQYTVSETNQTGYLASAWSGDCSVNGTITLLPGENKTCTITNDDIAPSLTLVKNVINNNGGTATAANWTLSATGPTTISGAGGAVSGVSFDAGTYTLSESGPTGYSASSWVCTGIQNSGTSITLGLGQSATCTIINDDIAPQLTVIKHVINDSDGTKLASDFTMSVLGTNVSVPSFPGSESGTTVTLNAGSYSVTETEDPIHYSRIDSSDCIGTIAIGEHKTCTITNNDIDHRPVIDVTKTANDISIPETGQDVLFTFTVENKSAEPVTINSLSDSVFGTLAGDIDCNVGTVLAIGGECSFTHSAFLSSDSLTSHINMFTAVANDNENNNATDSDNETVNFTDIPPQIRITKTANPTSVPETGGNVLFTFFVENIEQEDITLNSLVDDKFGNLDGQGTCDVPQTILIGGSYTCTVSKSLESNTLTSHVNVVIASATDDDGTPATDADDASVDFSDVPPSIFVNKVANPTVVPETGGDVTFTFTVLNTSSEESVTITSLNDSVYGTLAGDTDCGVGTELTSGAFCEFSITRWVEGDYSGPDHYNKFTAVAEDDDGTDATDDDDETVYLTDVWPTIEVTKTPNPTTVPETGANVTFTFTVKNTSSEEQVDITYLNDSDYGILTGDADCMLETVLIAGASCEFSIVRFVQGDYSGPDHNNIFTAKAEDNDNTEAIDTDDAIVEFTDVLPDISVLKTGNVSTVPETGGSVVFTYVVTNNSTEDGEITVLSDDKFGTLVGDADCYVGTVLSGGASCSFEETFSIPAGIAPETHTNIFTATVIDDDGKSDTDTDDETITLTPVPSIKLVKEVVNMFGSDSDESDWVLYATGEVKSFWNYGDEGDFEYVAPGIPYILTEDGEGDLDEEFEASDWVCTGGSLVKNVLTLTSEDDVTCTITNTALPATIIVKKDVIDSDKEDIYSNDSFDIVLSQEGIIDTQDIKDTVEPDIAQFTRLDAGEYSISEIVTNGYKFNGCYPEYIQEEESIRDFFNPISQNPLIEVENGETVTYICENQVIEPILEIAKSNDSDVAGEMAGNTVTYTLIVTTPDDESEGTYVVNDVMVTDILPFGFIYQPGTWTAISSLRGDLKTLLITGEPGYGNGIPGEWNLGDMIEGETVTLTYVAETNLLQDPGIYKDIAWTEGESVLGAQVLGTSVTEPSSNFVRTQVLIIEPVEIGEGQVLGATITLPRTGAETYLTLGALISMILGFILLVFNPKKKIKTLLLASVLLLGVFTLVKPMPSYAAVESIDVQIEQPQTPTNANEFKIGFVALDIEGREISVQCYETTKGAFGSPIVANSGSCEVNSSLITANGTYEFYVIATAGSGSEAESKSSNKVTVQVDLDKPSPVTNYLKTKGTCTYTLTFKTANDGQTSNIQIFRSSVQPFLANSTTIIDEFPVTPNTDVSYTDNDVLDCSKEYYYAIRAVDVFNNTSTFVTDNIVKVVIVQGTTTTGTGTTTTTTGGEVAGEETVTPDGTGGPDEGEVAGEETTNGGETDDNGTPNEEDEEDTGTDTKEATFWDWFKYVLIALGGIVLATVGYTYVRSRQNRN